MNPKHLRMVTPVAKLREGRTDWYTIKNQTDDTTEIMIYDEIGYFGVTASDFVRDISNLKTPSILLRLNSPGGEVFDGVAIYQALKDHPANITVQIDSLAASIASVIAMAGDEVIIGKNATMMIHDGSGLCVGNAADMKQMVDLLDQVSDNIASIYADRAGGTPASWRKKMTAETWYTANEAVKAGLADKIKGDGDVENTWDLSIFNYSGRDKAPEPNIQGPEFTWDPHTFKAAVEGAIK